MGSDTQSSVDLTETSPELDVESATCGFARSVATEICEKLTGTPVTRLAVVGQSIRVFIDESVDDTTRWQTIRTAVDAGWEWGYRSAPKGNQTPHIGEKEPDVVLRLKH